MEKPSIELSEEQIIQRCLDGDREAYSLLIEKYQQMVYTVSYRMLGEEAAAKDAAQESFLSAYLALKNFRKDAKFSSWLLSITLNKCRDILRAKKNTVSVLEMENTLPSKSASPEEHLRRKEEGDLLQAALSTLSEEYRTVIILKHIEGMDYREIATVCGESAGTLKVRAHRAREMLRDVLIKGGMIHG